MERDFFVWVSKVTPRDALQWEKKAHFHKWNVSTKYPNPNEPNFFSGLHLGVSFSSDFPGLCFLHLYFIITAWVRWIPMGDGEKKLKYTKKLFF